MDGMNLEERRRFVRVPCYNILEYNLLKKNGSPDEERYGYVHCQNVSLGGILFSSFEDIPLGTRLQLKLQMDCEEKQFEVVTMFGRVVRCRKRRESETWDVATSIVPVREEERSLSFFNWLAEKDEEYFLL